MKKYILLFAKCTKLTLSSSMAYKGDFFAHMLGYMIWSLVTPVLGLFVYSKSSGFPGWTFWEFILLQGCLLFVWGIYDSFIAGIVGTVSSNIEIGTFDKVLTKPVNPLVNLFCESQTTEGYSSLLLAPLIVVLALSKLNIFNAAHLLQGLLVLVLAILFMLAITISIAASAFFTVRTSGIRFILGLLWDYTKYPTDIFGKKAFWFFSFILPIATVSFYPASAILGRVSSLTVVYVTVAVILFFAASLLFWNYAIRKYSSAGG